jgi:DNA repair protein RecO (recombination protein O)
MIEIKKRGFVLRVIQAREADAVVRVLTSSGEKLSLFARAGLKSRKRFGGALEPFVQIDFRAQHRTGRELGVMEEAMVRQEFAGIRLKMERVTAASYVSELIETGAQEGLENREIYNLLGAALKALNHADDVVLILRQFEIKWLYLMGWMPQLDECNSCGARLELYLHPETQSVTCGACGVSALPLTKELRDSVQGLLSSSLAGMTRPEEGVEVSPTKHSRSLKRFTQSLIQVHLGGVHLKSLEFLNSLERSL